MQDVSGCPELAKTEYIHRHDKAASYIHWNVCHNYNIKTPEKWYDHEPETVTENEDVTILWDMPIHTKRKPVNLSTWQYHQTETHP